MSVNQRQLKDQIALTESIKFITQALGDVATSKLKSTRGAVTLNIKYFQDISEIYRIVKAISIKSPTKSRVPKVVRNGKTLICLITSNSHFYGGLDTQLTRFFIDKTSKVEADRVVIGRTGIKILKALKYPAKFSEVVFKDDSPTFEELNVLSKKVIVYSKIYVYHTKYESLLSQVPAITDLSTSEVEVEDIHSEFFYIVEPEIDKMIGFFEGQIIILLFRAVFLEVDISRLAARMIAMNQAEDNANKILQTEKRMLEHLRRDKLDLEVIENFSRRLTKTL